MQIPAVPPWPDQFDLVNLVDNITAWAFNILPNYSSTVAENVAIVTTRRCILFGFNASSTLGSTQYVQLYDRQSAPGSGAIPVASFAVTSASTVPINYFPGRFFRNGLVIVNSTAQNSYVAGAANCLFDVQYL